MNSSNECEECDTLCLNCSSKSTCDECSQGSHLNHIGTCECMPSFYYNFDKLNLIHSCNECSNKCLNCSGPNKNQCLTCKPNSIITQSQECLCKENMYFDEINSNCSFCHQNCNTCYGPSEDECGCFINSFSDNGTCICDDGYFGRSCELKFYVIYSDYSKSFKALPYSLTFFVINTDVKIFFEDKQDLTHIFFGREILPSFFKFDDYKTQNKSKYSGSFSYFTVFCASDQKCNFKISSEANGLSLTRDSIIAISVVLGVVFLIVIIAVMIKIRYSRNRMRNNKLQESEIDKFAPKEKFLGSEDTCSICLNDFVTKEEIRRIKKCNHAFHVKCIDEWLIQKAVCPNCNKRLK